MDAHSASVIPGLLRRSAEVVPDAPALAGPGRPALTYGDLHDQTIAVAGRLGRLGIKRHDRIALVHANGPELAAAFLAISTAAVCAPLNPAYRLSELEYYLSHLGATALMLEAGEHAAVRRLAQQRRLKVIEVGRDADGIAGRIELEARGAGK